MLNITPAAKQEWLSKLWVITLEILHIPAVWAAVQAVADELFLQEWLTYDEVCPLIDKAMSAYSQQPALGTGSRRARDIQGGFRRGWRRV